jgi:hypothetical protein
MGLQLYSTRATLNSGAFIKTWRKKFFPYNGRDDFVYHITASRWSVLEISFPAFTPRITIQSERELSVEIVTVAVRGSPTPSTIRLSRFVMAW